jgi:hypothetical protein
MEQKINQVGEEFKPKTQPLGTQAFPFDPNARIGVIRGLNRQEYRVPKAEGVEGAEDDGAGAQGVGGAEGDEGAAANLAANENR